MKDIGSDPELQAAFVHGMMFADEANKAGLNVTAIGERLCRIWDIGDVERTAQEYGDKISALLLARPL